MKIYNEVGLLDMEGGLDEENIQLLLEISILSGGIDSAESDARLLLGKLRDVEGPQGERERLAAWVYANMADLCLIKRINRGGEERVAVDDSPVAIARCKRYCSIVASYVGLFHSHSDISVYEGILSKTIKVRAHAYEVDPTEVSLHEEVKEKGMFSLENFSKSYAGIFTAAV
jgi:hypothetical protein